MVRAVNEPISTVVARNKRDQIRKVCEAVETLYPSRNWLKHFRSYRYSGWAHLLHGALINKLEKSTYPKST